MMTETSIDKALYDKGLQVLMDLGWTRHADTTPPNPDLDQGFWDFTLENLLGRIWGRPNLTVRDREVVVLGVLTTVVSPVGIANHLRNAHAVGLTEQKTRELMAIVGAIAGWDAYDAAANQFDVHLAEDRANWPEDMKLGTEVSGGDPVERLERLLDLGWADAVPRSAASLEPSERARADLSRMSGDTELPVRDRFLVATASLIALNRDETRGLFAHASELGFDEPALREIVMQAGYYSGWPKFAEATVRLNKSLAAK